MLKTGAVTSTQLLWSSPMKDPGCLSSVRIGVLRDVPAVPDQAQNVQMHM